MTEQEPLGKWQRVGRSTGERLTLPPRLFLFTLDQVSAVLELELASLKNQYIFYEGRHVGVKKPDFIVARNIAPAGEKPDWRVAERELLRWLKRKGFRIYERVWINS